MPTQLVRDIMTTSVVGLPADATLVDAARDMRMRLETTKARLVDTSERPSGTLKVTTTVGLGSIWLVWRILGRVTPDRQLLGTVLFAWNPVIIVELSGEVAVCDCVGARAELGGKELVLSAERPAVHGKHEPRDTKH